MLCLSVRLSLNKRLLSESMLNLNLRAWRKKARHWPHRAQPNDECDHTSKSTNEIPAHDSIVYE